MSTNYERIGKTLPILGGLGILYNVIMAVVTGCYDFSLMLNLVYLFLFSTLSALCILPGLAWAKIFHPILLALIMTISLIQDPTHYYGFVFFMLFLLFSHAYGYLERRFLLKVIAKNVYFIGLAIISALVQKKDLRTIIGQFIFCLGALIIIYELYRANIANKAKPTLDFKAIGITGIHEDICRLVYANDRVDSKTLAQLLSAQLEDEYKPSYIDNHLSAIFRKLEVGNRAELKAYLSRYRLD